MQIYTDFIFQEFLFKFRRFFSFRKSLIEKKIGDKDSDPKTIIVNENLKKLKKKVR